MKPSDFQSSIRRSWSLVDELKLGETFSCPVSLKINDAFRDLCLSDEPSYSEVYLKGLGLSYYNFLLQDYSYFHFGQDSDDDLRYAFYPNPFASGRPSELARFRRLKHLVELGDITHEESLSILQDKFAESRIPLIRYENAPGQYKRFAHPCSHLHIGHHSENRWAVRRILTPYAFTLLVVKHYYSSYWNECGGDAMNCCGNVLEEKLMLERRDECRLISDDFFADDESRSFFFS